MIQLLTHDDAYEVYSFEVNVWEKEISAQSLTYNLKYNLNRIPNHEYKIPRLGLLMLFMIVLIIYLLP